MRIKAKALEGKEWDRFNDRVAHLGCFLGSGEGNGG